MALVVEDGTVVTGANSYVDVAYVRAYAESRGITLDSDDAKLETQIIVSTDFIDSFEPRFKGSRASAIQELAWPRKNVVINGFKLAPTDIPALLKQAQAQAAVEVAQGADLNPNQTGYAVRREKVDVIEVEYATGGGTNNSATPQFAPVYTKIMVKLTPLFRSTLGQLFVERA